jgi:sugar lactone lactonase YvrE
MGNVTMTRALEFAGYDVKHSWGTAGHQGNHASAVFPDAMRWLWRDYPAPVKVLNIGNPRLKEIVKPGESWDLATLGCAPIVSLATDPHGQVSFRANGAQAPVAVASDAKPKPCDKTTQPGSGAAFAFGADGTRYLALATGGIQISGSAGGASKVVASNLLVHNFVVRNNGDIYATTEVGSIWGGLWLIDAQGAETKLDDKIKGPSGLALTPDGLWLFVAQNLSHEGLSYRVLPEGKLDMREPFYDMYAPETEDDSGAGEIAMDANGLAYVATRLGVQVFDRNGRVVAILPMPGGEAATGVSFGGPKFDTLYVATVGGRIYMRKLQVVGVPPFAPPIKLPKGSAG